MQKFLKNQLINQHLRKIEYKSIISRFLNKNHENKVQQINPFSPQQKQQNVFLSLLLDTELDERPKDLTEYNPRDRITLNVNEDIQIFLEDNKEISDLEKQRLQNIDKVLGTKTHFHEILPYEERLDSEHVMETKIINSIRKTSNTRPLEENSCLKYKKFYTIYEFSSVEDQKQDVFENEMNQKRIEYFTQIESVYTDMSLFKVGLMEEQMLQELKNRTQIQNIIPFYTKKFIYYNQDLDNVLNIFRVSNENFLNKPLSIKDLQKEEILSVLTKQEIINFLENYIEFDKRIEYLADELELQTVYYKNIIFNKNHDKIAFVFDIYNNNEEYICIVKDLKKNQLIQRIISNIHYQLAFDDFDNIYFVQKNDLKRYSTLSYLNLEDKNISIIQPIKILDEKNPNFQLQRNEQNQLYFKETYLKNAEFRQITCPYKPNNFLSYNMQQRINQTFYEIKYNKFNQENYVMENLEAISRDGINIPFTLVYNKQFVNSNSPCILYLNSNLEERTQYELNPVFISAFDRGAIICYPHMREWFI
ncbi:prolyl oligopeptidase family protein, putative [Ichthyophthirius multifiliis]|uniref:Prolyl oligopeptidase family protein, putative n=1 Tax=Ichthyophthirius multifiliis TaxID=5932 RepID=G0R0R2_ICHMU|nr:prolyl oligopeptidase family protein, putative [Ichthyophthirius multifiliis]EGR28946.1 prolyl oligopeptidase family protein, putative [Ichthyophthirius multifiliis]|eukprot:XP_004030182.1 prolyl oligopeptidase family protein, putative [Ichthyophthirius multifiliis]